MHQISLLTTIIVLFTVAASPLKQQVADISSWAEIIDVPELLFDDERQKRSVEALLALYGEQYLDTPDGYSGPELFAEDPAPATFADLEKLQRFNLVKSGGGQQRQFHTGEFLFRKPML